VRLYRADRGALTAVHNGSLALHSVPRLPHDLHSMADLNRFADLL
jgi:hypothetical protein